jgi:sigma-B regulation protein RsbU (phosphoserine phosphatase)
LTSGATVALTSALLREAARGVRSLAREVGLANVVQEALQPDQRPQRRGDLVLRGLSRSATAVGGDYWTWAELPNGRWFVLIGDVTGHGAPAALLAAVAKGAIDAVRLAKAGALDPAALLSVLNRSIHGVGKSRYLMTAFALVVDAGHQKLTFANAGHEFPYIVQSKSGGLELHRLIARGNALGAAADTRYQNATQALGPGERVLLYTDGVNDTLSTTGEAFGEKRLRRALAASAGQPLVDLTPWLDAQLEDFRSGQPLADDYTLVVVGREAAGPA